MHTGTDGSDCEADAITWRQVEGNREDRRLCASYF